MNEQWKRTNKINSIGNRSANSKRATQLKKLKKRKILKLKKKIFTFTISSKTCVVLSILLGPTDKTEPHTHIDHNKKKSQQHALTEQNDKEVGRATNNDFWIALCISIRCAHFSGFTHLHRRLGVRFSSSLSFLTHRNHIKCKSDAFNENKIGCWFIFSQFDIYACGFIASRTPKKTPTVQLRIERKKIVPLFNWCIRYCTLSTCDCVAPWKFSVQWLFNGIYSLFSASHFFPLVIVDVSYQFKISWQYCI